jgi:hypothetical protein
MNYQYNETNVMHFSFNLLRIKGLCMFRALLAHPQEALHIRHMEYFVRMSVGCGTVALQTCQYDKTNKMYFLYSVHYELTAATCFEHYLLIFRRCCTNNWYIVCVLCLIAANRHNIHAIYQLFVQHLLKMRKCCSKHVEAINS